MTSRNTRQRKSVLESVRRLGCHPTAEEVYRDISLLLPSISRATVYRNLHVLADEGALLRVCEPDGAARYDHRADRHFHAVCDICGRCEDVFFAPPPELFSPLSEGFRITGYSLIFSGICARCLENKKETENDK